VLNGVPGAPTGAGSLGDLRAQVKVPLLRGATGLALRLVLSFPTGGSDRFAGGAGMTVTPSVLLARTFGRVTLASQAGFRLRGRNALGAFEVNDELHLTAGARVALSDRWSLLTELQAWLTVDPGPGQDRQMPVEATAAARWNPSNAVSVCLGLGRGLTEGYGTPELRVYGGVRVTVTPDRCAAGPEDYDGFEDGDYCRDPDNDRDGIPDERDRCENDPEDRDGVLDDDGCPDPDNDGDGVLDDLDRCPVDPEDHDGYQDGDGCPEPDNDRDGIADVTDTCANEPEDRDGYQDDDGCPEPGPDAATVTRSGARLLVNQRVFFDYDSDTLSNVCFPILDAVADALAHNPDIQRLRVEGHTDAQGSPEYNLDLSFRRARSVVEYLVRRGVERGRLEFQGYGQTRPVSQEDTPEALALNRRVDFTITQALHGPAVPEATPRPPPPRPPPRR
jgi:outer membrane protein OmpA-like peptidoglycan-associated protein